MSISFATCDRSNALQFLNAVCESEITDTPDCAGPLLDLVEIDLVRIQDPMMYGKRIGIVPGKKWDESRRDEVMEACREFDRRANANGEEV